MANTSKRIGQMGEEIASRTVTRHCKMKIIERNFRSRIGEIDIIALDKNTWVFIEVKTRAILNAGFPEESVTEYKQDKIRKVALYYLISQGYNPNHINYRFDVISITFTGDNYTHPQVKYYKNAF